MSSPSAVYRALLRQANKAVSPDPLWRRLACAPLLTCSCPPLCHVPQSIHAPAKRNAGLQSHLRQMAASLPAASAPTYQAAADELLEVAKFMEAQRVHGVRVPPPFCCSSPLWSCFRGRRC